VTPVWDEAVNCCSYRNQKIEALVRARIAELSLPTWITPVRSIRMGVSGHGSDSGNGLPDCCIPPVWQLRRPRVHGGGSDGSRAEDLRRRRSGDGGAGDARLPLGEPIRGQASSAHSV
jgi:hypothetical protein